MAAEPSTALRKTAFVTDTTGTNSPSQRPQFHAIGLEDYAEGRWSPFPPDREDAKKYVIVRDLDSDTLIINYEIYLPLSNLPRNLQQWAKAHDGVYVGTGPIWERPPLEENLIDLYRTSTRGELIVPDLPHGASPHYHLMTSIQRRLGVQCRTALLHTWTEYGPQDERMQIMVYAYLKASSWHALSFEMLEHPDRSTSRRSQSPTSSHFVSSDVWCSPYDLPDSIAPLQRRRFPSSAPILALQTDQRPRPSGESGSHFGYSP
jgi:hypothetical protein